jgi:hypothetical protein
MSDQEQLRAAMEPFCSDFGRWPTVIIHSACVRKNTCFLLCHASLSDETRVRARLRIQEERPITSMSEPEQARQRRQQQGASVVKKSSGRKPPTTQLVIVALSVGSSWLLARKLILTSRLLGT